MATRKRDRFFALFFAILFLGTSSALAIAILVSNLQSRHQDNGATSAQNSANSNLLAGTKLTNFTPVEKISQLQAVDTVAGTGEVVKSSDNLTLDYTGALASTGIIFESSKDTGTPATRPLTDFISGWVQGVPGMKVGGTRRLLIPASLGYGSGVSEKIPANSDLVFDITVHSINK